MDFSNNAFRTNKSSTLSTDTMSHAQLVQACRFGWSAGPNITGAPAPLAPTPAPARTIPPTSLNDARSKRLSACKGRLYHQLTCSHRIRTDLVEDCGSNCLEPFGTGASIPFYCQECVENEAAKIWEDREAHLNASFPPLDQMSKEQYETWYDERRQLEAQFARDRKVYEAELRGNSRPTNICSMLEMSKEEKDFAAELDSLSLSLMAPHDEPIAEIHSQIRQRVSLPSDASNQLHWSLNSLAIDRGSCGVEYSTGSPVQPLRPMSEEELWAGSRQRN